MSEKEKKELENTIKQLRQLPPAQQSMCTGFVLGIRAAAALSGEETAAPCSLPGAANAERGAASV